MAPPAFPLFQLPPGLLDLILDLVVGCLDYWDLAAARSASRALRAAAGRRATRLVFFPASLQRESDGDLYVQVEVIVWASGHCTCHAIGDHSRGRQKRCPRPPPAPQKRCPTAFQLFPNAREVVLTPSDVESSTEVIRRADVLDVFRPPTAPADAAAARAALAGVTRLEMRGSYVERGELAAALLHLPGLREVSLSFESEIGQLLEADELGDDLVATLAACPAIESLEWEVVGCWPSGAPGSRERARARAGVLARATPGRRRGAGGGTPLRAPCG
jgi:hypothetical protein